MNKYYGISYEEFSYLQSTLDLSAFRVRAGDRFYHYASVDAMQSILTQSDGKYTLWASHLAFLNDREEFINGKRLISKMLNRFLKYYLKDSNKEGNDLFISHVKKFVTTAKKEEISGRSDESIVFNNNIYIICFCCEENSLNQWKYYGKENGIALEFALDNCEYSNLCVNNRKKIINVQPYRVIYDEREKKDVLTNIIGMIYQRFLSEENTDRERNLDADLANLYGLCPLFKHPDFKDEKECRLMFRPIYSTSAEDKDVRTLINYRKRGNILLPYMEINIKSSSDEPLIKSITIGPGTDQDLLYKSVFHFSLYRGVFDQYGKGADGTEVVKRHIKKSSTPFRG